MASLGAVAHSDQTSRLATTALRKKGMGDAMASGRTPASASKSKPTQKASAGKTTENGPEDSLSTQLPAQNQARLALEQRLFKALSGDGTNKIAFDALTDALAGVGLLADDPRLVESIGALRDVASDETDRPSLTYEQFREVIKPNIVLIERSLQGSLVIPDFLEFTRDIHNIYEKTRNVHDGAVADYIPQLARVDPRQFGVALCTVDGQRFSVGDAQTEFCVQSCCKPINYCIALENRGEDVVHRHVGREPSGHSFNELTLNPAGLPHNPMINAGAVMSCSLIRPDLSSADRFDYVTDVWRRLAAHGKPGFSNPTYLSERQTADQNFALAYFMRQRGAFPEGIDLIETLEFYFQCCSIEMTTESMSMVAATFANGGICPLTEERVFEPDTVQKCLSLMSSCGMYDFSGEWAFSIGIPAKSGVSGAVIAVIPNVMGICAWSPPLDEIGNSVRGVSFFRELVSTFKFHNYDNLVGGQHKRDPRNQLSQARGASITDLCWAASQGDLGAVRRLVAKGVPLDAADYDGRTALHLAVSSNRQSVVEFLLAQGVDVNTRDRWGGTPLDDALRENCGEIQRLLEQQGGARGSDLPTVPMQ